MPSKTGVASSQATEEVIGDGGKRVPTLLFNGYGEFVADLYKGREGEKLFSWVRVAMPMAGKQFGQIGLPRVGQEVVVQFLGDSPDRPIITGRVYNGGNMPHASNAGRDDEPGNSPPADLPAAA